MVISQKDVERELARQDVKLSENALTFDKFEMGYCPLAGTAAINVSRWHRGKEFKASYKVTCEPFWSILSELNKDLKKQIEEYDKDIIMLTGHYVLE